MRFRNVLLPLLLVAAAPVPCGQSITIYLVGDSTMAPKLEQRRPETGWGEAFQQFFERDVVRISNHAMNGRSTRTFIAEGRWHAIVDSLRGGDYVFVQFGHNDGSKDKVDRYTPPGDYRRNLLHFVADVRAKGATPVLLTPVVRRRFDSAGRFYDTHGEYPDIVRSVAEAEGVTMIDLHRRTQELLTRLGVEDSRRLFLHLAPGAHANYPDGITDDTHFSPAGAETVARLAYEALVALEPHRFRASSSDSLAVPARYDYIVAQDGSGDFRTIQDAVNAVRDYTPIPRTIYIRNGIYREKLLIPSWKTGITLVGESVDGTVVEWSDHAGQPGINTFTSYTARISGDDIRVHNITFRNTAGPVGQALALFVEGDRVLFENCRFIGHQDTIFAAGEGSRQYFRNVTIEGTTDFIFGPATAYFEDCRIHSKSDSYITAASTPADVRYGFVFVACTLTADPGVSRVYLGRPWRDHARTVFLHSELGPHIVAEGWHNWSRPEAQRTVDYAEYGNTGPGAARSGRVSWSRQLDAAGAAKYTKENVLCAGSCASRPWYDAAVVVR